MNTWTVYTGSDEQIFELMNAKKGYVLRLPSTKLAPGINESEPLYHKGYLRYIDRTITHYWLIPADPLREMKVRQAKTGQPVWVKHDEHWGCVYKITTTPDWGIPGAEYSFTDFVEPVGP